MPIFHDFIFYYISDQSLNTDDMWSKILFFLCHEYELFVSVFTHVKKVSCRILAMVKSRSGLSSNFSMIVSLFCCDFRSSFRKIAQMEISLDKITLFSQNIPLLFKKYMIYLMPTTLQYFPTLLLMLLLWSGKFTLEQKHLSRSFNQLYD